MTDYERKRFGDLVFTPSCVQEFSGERKVRAFLKGEILTLHFPNVHTIPKMESLHAKFAAAVASSLGGTYGGELVLTMDKGEFERKFGSLTL